MIPIDFRKLYDEVSAIAGNMMNLQEVVALYCAAKGTVLEIGAWKGLSTVFLSHAPGVDVVYSVDPHEGVLITGPEPETWTAYGDVLKRFAAKNVFTFRGASKHFPQVIVPDFVFIDGSHVEEDVAFDLSLVPKQSTLAIDDLGYEGVGRAFETWRRSRTIVPVDLRQYPIEDPAHNRLHEGHVGKMGIFQVIG